MADGSEELVLNALGALLEFLQVTPQAKKVWFEGGFAKRTQILGVLYVLDVEPKYCQVPADKVQRTTALGDRVAGMTWVPADLCQELMGLLIFHGRVLLSAKWHLPFTVRGAAVAATHGVAPMTEAWRTELAWWRKLLTEWNCVALLVPHRYIEWKQEPFLTPMTDASRSKSKGTGAAGAMFGRWYQHWDFSAQEIQELHIMELEGVALVVWLRFLCSEPEAVALLKGRRFLMRCDNDPFVKTVNRRHSTYPSVAFLLGEIHHLMAVHSFDLRLEYINTKLNIGADALSRHRPVEYFEYMREEFEMDASDLVCVPVQNDYRNLVTSTMMSLKRSASLTQKPPRRDSAVRQGNGSFSADGQGAR